MSGRKRHAWWEEYGDDVPETLGLLALRRNVGPDHFARDLRVLLGDDWLAIEAHIRAHVIDGRYEPCTTLPGHLCDRWCPHGGDPELTGAA